MATLHIATAAAGLLLAALQRRWPAFTVERNRTAPFAAAALPAFVLLDEGHDSAEGPELGYVTLTCRLAVLWYGDAASADVTREAHLMHAETLRALTAGPFLLPDGQPFWPVERNFTLDTNSAEGATDRAVGWRADLELELIAPIGALTVTV
jgi:hypothetical protein